MQLTSPPPQPVRTPESWSAEPVFHAPVEGPQCTAWCPRTGALWIGAWNGVVLCDRVIGQQLYALKEPPAALAMRPDGEVGLLVGQSGAVTLLRRSAATPGASVSTGLHGRFRPFCVRGRFFVAGVGSRGGRLLEVQSQGMRRVARLPEGSDAGPGIGGPEIVRMLDGRMITTAPETTGLRASDPSTIVRHCGRHVVSWTTEAVCVWRHQIDVVSTLVQQVSCADVSPDGRFLAVGTLDGHMGIIDLTRVDSRRRPTLRRVSRTPIRSIRYAPDGEFLAVLGEHVDVWDTGGGTW